MSCIVATIRGVACIEGAKGDETVKSKYDSCLLGLKVEPSDVVCQEDGISGLTVESPKIIEEECGGLSEGVPSFAIEFAVVLSHATTLWEWFTASQIVYLLNDTSFNLSYLRRYIKSVVDYEYVTTKDTRELAEGYEFRSPGERWQRKEKHLHHIICEECKWSALKPGLILQKETDTTSWPVCKSVFFVSCIPR